MVKKVVVLGNCQARPVANLLKRGVSDLEILGVVVLHLSKSEERESHIDLMERADIIFAQNTSNSFEPSHLSSYCISSLFPEKTIVWPNIFYSGQQPFLRYVTGSRGARIVGPLDTYHDLRLLKEWYISREVNFNISDLDQQAVHMKSVDELKRKESSCDVTISDIIEDRHLDTRLFFTFNHPTLFLIDTMVIRLAEASGLIYLSRASDAPEPLDRIVVPSVWHEWPGNRLPFRGPKVNPTVAPYVQDGPPLHYDMDEVRDLSMQCYDAQAEVISDPGCLRLTPAY